MVRLLFLCVLLSVHQVCLALFAQVDKTQTGLKQAVELTVQAWGRYEKKHLNLTPLKQNFLLFNVRVTQDKRTNRWRSVWRITLLAKKTGHLTVPVLRLGAEHSRAIDIEVSSALDTSGKKPNVILRTQVDATSVYVHSQIVLTQMLYQRSHVTEGILSEPRLVNTIIKRLAQDESGRTTIQGVDYQVTKRHYAIIPQQAGDLLIPPSRFSGRLSGRHDELAQSFLRPKTTISAKSQPITVTVQAIPSGFTKTTWLASAQFSLAANWEDATPFKVGEPKARRIALTARGLLDTQLPVLTLPQLTHFKVYLEVGDGRTEQSAQGLLAQQQYRVTYIPLQPGWRTLPELRIPWWDTQANRRREAVVAPIRVSVLPGQVVHNAPPTPTVPNVTPAPTPAQAEKAWQWPDGFRHPPPVQTLFVVLLLVSFLLLARYWKSPERKRQAVLERKDKRLARIEYNIENGCHTQENAYVYHQLLTWANTKWPTQTYINLTQVADSIGSADLHRKMAKLNRTRFKATHKGWNGNAFWRVFKAVAAKPEVITTKKTPLLPDLYR